ncbi:MAG: hypothetical protein ACRC3A_03145 [Culicoidibacterales bacterium]
MAEIVSLFLLSSLITLSVITVLVTAPLLLLEKYLEIKLSKKYKKVILVSLVMTIMILLQIVSWSNNELFYSPLQLFFI